MTGIPVRVMVLDAWDEVRLEAAPDALVSDLAARALALAGQPGDPAGYLVKYQGAELYGTATLADAGIGADAPLIVLPRRRTPVR